ncbi:hypothetical protein CR513_39247, partial [Mucuna pruriens]
MADTTFEGEDDEELKEEQTNDLSKVNTFEVTKLQEKVIDLRQSLSKFFNGTKNISKLLKYSRCPHEKFGFGFEKEKEIKEKLNIHCSNCRKFGHRSYDCRKRPKGSSKPLRTNLKGPKKTSMCLIIGRKPLLWYLDNGCSRHMMGEESMFQDLRPKKGGWVTFRGNQKGKIVGVGRIDKHPFLSIDNVLYVKGLKHNQLSISQLCDIRYDVSFNKGECIVKDYKGSIIYSTKRQNNLYQIDLEDLTNQNVTCLVSINDYQWMWYKKL